MRWHDLLAGLDVRERRGDDVEITSITEDSRRVVPGSCFACRVGARVDGHERAGDAATAGAVALLVERPLALDLPQAVVDDVLRVLGPAAARLHGEPSRALRCLGVTGTAGKTTTTRLLAAIARAAGEHAGVIGSDGVLVDDEVVAVDLSTPTSPPADQLQELLALMRDRGVGTVALEVTSRALDQHRVDGTWFAAACFTNLSHEHLDDHRGSIDAYFEAKASLFRADRVGAVATNADDVYGAQVAQRARAQGIDTWTYGLDDDAVDLTACDVAVGAHASSFMLLDRRASARAPVDLQLVGRFNVLNALAAAATARAAGVELEAVAAGLRAARGIPGRTEPIEAGQPFTVLVDYAHAPGELASVLAVARALAAPGARVIVTFGCGGDRDPSKRPLMGAAAAAGADVVVVTTDNSRSEDPRAIIASILPPLRDEPAVDVVVELDRRAAIAAALQRARPGDTVVIAGKGAEATQTTGDRVEPFDDRVVARDELKGLGWS